MKNRYSMSCLLFVQLFISSALLAQSYLTVSNVPLDFTIECSETPGMITPVITSTCPDGDATVSFVESETNVDCFNNYTIVRTWTATDPCGNSEVITQHIFVEDKTAPVFAPVTLNLYATCSEIPAMANLQISDNCDTDVELSLIEFTNNDDCSTGYTITRIWEATDDCGNKSTQSQFIHVEPEPLTTSTEELDDKNLEALVDVFPNPGHEQLFVRIDAQLKTAKINLFDTNGQLVRTFTDKMALSGIDLSPFSPGFYWLQLQTNRGLINKRITVIKS